MDESSSDEVLRLSLELDRSGAEPLVGHVAVAEAPPQRFSGWLGLIATLESALRRSPAERIEGQ